MAFLTNIPLYAVFILLKLYRLIRVKITKNKKKKSLEKTTYEETVKLKDPSTEKESSSDISSSQAI